MVTPEAIAADVHIFSKHWTDDRVAARASPCAVFDVCDDWFTRVHPVVRGIGDYYREMCGLCSVTCSSEALAEIILEQTGKVAEVIPEPYEGPDGLPRELGEPLRVLWFGHKSNLKELQRHTVPDGVGVVLCTNAVGAGIVPWSVDNLALALAACDVVIIPQSHHWKSANRMVESLRAGRFVVASDIPAYRGFDQYLGDIREGLEWVKSNTGHIISRIISGRKRLDQFSPASINRQWSSYISGLVNGTSGITST